MSRTSRRLKKNKKLQIDAPSGKRNATKLKLGMSNVNKQISTVHHVIEPIPAANADQIGVDMMMDQTIVETESTSTGWDSYQVWRRFIKEARDRRRPQT
jgi:hypothetical protein